jgi:hypothetical protein
VETNLNISAKMKITEEEKDWWATLDMNDSYLCNLWSKMFGTVEQRIKQLYIIRNNQDFARKKD